MQILVFGLAEHQTERQGIKQKLHYQIDAP